MSSGPRTATSPDKIKGNLSSEARQILSNPAALFGRRYEPRSVPVFCEGIHRRFVVTEASIENKREDEKKKQAFVVAELDVTDDMTNVSGGIHGGCLAYLVDSSTTLALVAYSIDVDGKFFGGVSQTMNIAYHSPAAVGDKLRMVSYTVAGGSRAKTARCEIWNATRHRLVASGSHIKMNPSKPKL